MIIIYISEAHPTDGWVISNGKQPDVSIHKTMTDRLSAVEIFSNLSHAKTDAKIYVDKMENEIEKLFLAHPERLAIVNGEKIEFIARVF